MPSALYPRIPLRSIRATLVTPFLARTFHPRIPLRSIRATLVTPFLACTFIPVFRFAPYGLRWLHHSSRAPFIPVFRFAPYGLRWLHHASRAPSSPYSASLHTGYAGYTIPRVHLHPRIPLRSIRATLVTPFLACTFIPVFRFAPYGLRWLHHSSRAPSSPYSASLHTGYAGYTLPRVHLHPRYA